MATKSFLTDTETEWAKSHFLPPSRAQKQHPQQLGFDFSAWLGDLLEQKFKSHAQWRAAQPIAMGSWARGELCPKSDIDMIFCGPEDVVQTFVGQMQSRGLRLRARVPQDATDWTIGVEAFDVLAILNGRAFDDATARKLAEQKDLIRGRGASLARNLLRAIQNEKANRQKRFDSVANYLEPNIKYGPGGLRDLEQALAIRNLFADRFNDEDKSRSVFHHFKGRWLAIRQWLHLNGGGDLISGPDQPHLAHAFGEKQWQEFMADFQRGISEVNFYANLVIAQAEAKRPKRTKKFTTGDEALKALQTDPGVINQARIREALPKMTGLADWASYFKVTQKEEFFTAIFDSRLIDLWLKDVARLRGLVQHDHYHRFTADAHLLQAVREVIRAKRRPRHLGKLQPWVKKQDGKGWQILLWTALFHDLAKGLGGDHSNKGGHLVERDLGKIGVEKSIIEEVKWMVLNHLTLSTAAFRMNVQDPKTWQLLYSQGAVGERLDRLALFTAMDIRATNPEAWNDWKERLLADLLKAMASAPAEGFISLLAEASPHAGKELVSEIDPAVAQAIPASRLMADLKKARRAKKDLPVLALKNRRREMWIRFHSHTDKNGLFLQYVSKLFALGCSIQQSAVRTVPHLGVYDWFQVKTQKRPQAILKQLDLLQDWSHVDAPAVKLRRIEVISHTAKETILSFRGKDQKGVLLNTAQALFEMGYTIRWAKVMTWGSQIDDVFAVSGGPNIDHALLELCQRFDVKPEISTKLSVEGAAISDI